MNSAIGTSWKDARKEIYSQEDILESDMRVALISAMIQARNEKGISQKKLEELSGVSQPVIARIEKGTSVPNLNTLIRLLAPLGKTLQIQDISRQGNLS